MSTNGSLNYYRGVMNYAVDGAGVEHLTQLLTPEGFVAREGNAWVYKYFITDHIGSTRTLLAARSSGGTTSLVSEQETDYFPFGLMHTANDLDKNRYLFSGKELQDVELGTFGILGQYDFGARYYSPFLGRWFSQDPALQGFNPYVYCNNSPAMYIDPNGEWAIIDDIAAAIIGGLLNSVGGLITGDINSVGHFFSAFGVGAAGGWATLYAGPLVGGAIIGAGNSVLSQGFNNGWDNINAGAVIFSGAVGGFTAGAASQLSGAISPAINSVTGSIASPVLQGAVSEGVTGAATGFTIGSGMSLMMGESFSDAMKAGGSGAMVGLTVGTVSGGAKGFSSATKNNVNPWTGNKPKSYYPPNDGAAGEWESTTLEPGTVIDRYGKETGRFAAPEGTPIQQRSLPYDAPLDMYNKYEVIQQLPVQKSIVAPAFGQPGGGVQYKLMLSVDDLIKNNHIMPIK